MVAASNSRPERSTSFEGPAHSDLIITRAVQAVHFGRGEPASDRESAVRCPHCGGLLCLGHAALGVLMYAESTRVGTADRMAVGDG